MTSERDGSSYDVVVIGASQAGLAMGYHLAQKRLAFLILDAGPEIGHVWPLWRQNLSDFAQKAFQAKVK